MPTEKWKLAFKKFYDGEIVDDAKGNSGKETINNDSETQTSNVKIENKEHACETTKSLAESNYMTSEKYCIPPSDNDFNVSAQNLVDFNEDEQNSSKIFKEKYAAEFPALEPVIKEKNPVVYDSRRKKHTKKKQFEEEFPEYSMDEFPPLDPVIKEKNPVTSDLKGKNNTKKKEPEDFPKNYQDGAVAQNVMKNVPRFRRFKNRDQTYKMSDFNDAGINIKFNKTVSGIHRYWKNIKNYDKNDRCDLDYDQSDEKCQAPKELQESKPQSMTIGDSTCVTEKFSNFRLNDFDGAGINCFKTNSNLSSMEKELKQSEGFNPNARSEVIRRHYNNDFRPYRPVTGIIAVKELTYEDIASRPQPIIDPEEAWDKDFLY